MVLCTLYPNKSDTAAKMGDCCKIPFVKNTPVSETGFHKCDLEVIGICQ